MIRIAALLLTLLTGFAGLVYEVAWQKYLATLLGSHGEATAAVLGIFLGGLAAGYALFGRATLRLVERARRRGRPLRLLRFYGWVELAIGLYALVFPQLFGAAQTLSLLAPLGRTAAAFGFDVLLSALLIGPPAVLMGGTIPILTLALAGSLEQSTRVHAQVYGFNTLGAFSGALAGGFLVVPALGLDGSVRAMAVLNLLAGLAFTQLDRGSARRVPDLGTLPLADAPRRVLGYAAVALLAGFAMMTLQTTLIRIGALSFGASHFTFAMVVAAFVLCIGLGSLAVSALPKIPRGLIDGALWATVGMLFLLYLRLPDSTYWAYWIRTLFRQTDAAFYPYHGFSFAALLALLALPIGLSGALLPLLFHHLRREVGDLGAVAGRIYAWNTVGSLLGALLGGYLLLLWLDLDQVYRVALAALAGGAGLLTALLSGATGRRVGALPVLATWGALLMLPGWNPARLAAGLFRQREPVPGVSSAEELFRSRRQWGEPIFYEDDPSASVAVMDQPDPEGRLRLSLLVNGKSDGNLIIDYPTMALAGLVPALLARSHARCFVIGYGTGVTAGELASLDETREVEVAEISRGVIHAAPLFDPGNHGASTHPKVAVRRGDAYRSLLQTQGEYDLIVSEPSNPWVNGVEMLYSVEFLRAARDRLAPGGVYAQWFHSYESDSASIDLVLRTYASVYPYVSVWFTLGSDLLLLGFEGAERALDVAAVEARFRRPDFRTAFGRVGIESLAGVFAHELLPLGTLHAGELPGELHTLRHPRLSHLAARAFFRGRDAPLPRFTSPTQAAAGSRNSLLRRHAGVTQGPLPEAVLEAAARESCRWGRLNECATLLASWRHGHPQSARAMEVRAQLAAAAGAEAAAGPLSRGSVLALVPFFAGERMLERLDAGGMLPLQRVMNTSNRYRLFYHHAVPFNPLVLEALWSRCAGERCQEARRQLGARVGELEGLAELAEEGTDPGGRSPGPDMAGPRESD